MTAPRRTLKNIVNGVLRQVVPVEHRHPDDAACVRAACEEYAAGEVAALLTTLRDIAAMGTGAAAWNVEGRIEGIVEMAQDALAKHGGGK